MLLTKNLIAAVLLESKPNKRINHTIASRSSFFHQLSRAAKYSTISAKSTFIIERATRNGDMGCSFLDFTDLLLFPKTP